MHKKWMPYIFIISIYQQKTQQKQKKGSKNLSTGKKTFATSLSLLSCNKGTAEERIAAVTSHQVVLSFASRKKS